MAEDRGEAHGQAPAVVRRKKVIEGGGHHGGAWKVAYADMVTALMALFIVLWILTSSEAVKESVARYFAPSPIGFETGGAPAASTPGAGDHGGAAALLPGAAPAGQRDPGGELLTWGRAIRSAIAKMPSLDRYHEQIEITSVAEGLRIELLESNDTPLFVRGSTALAVEARDLLEMLGSQIAASGRSIVIEGHTDSTPWRTGGGNSNWDLSTERAHTARRIFERAGVPDEHILEVRGFADRQLYNPDDPSDSRNRRVSLTLLSDRALARRRVAERGRVLSWSQP